PDETITPLVRYRFAAEKAAPGHYPEWLRRRQVYWTLVGLPDDDEESLLDEYGNLEPTHGGTTLMPYLWVNGQLRSALDADHVEQALEDGHLPLPRVTWEVDGLRMTVRACAEGAPGRSAT